MYSGARHRNEHYGHSHSTHRHAIAINDFGHSEFCIILDVYKFNDHVLCRDVARHGLGGLKPPKFLVSPQIEFSPLCNMGYIKSN